MQSRAVAISVRMCWYLISLVGAAAECLSCLTPLGLSLRRIGFAKCFRPALRGTTGCASCRFMRVMGVGYLWLVDPDQLTLEAYRLPDGHWLLLTSHAEDDVVRAAPFEAVEFDLGKLWA